MTQDGTNLGTHVVCDGGEKRPRWDLHPEGTAFDTNPGVRRAAPTRLATANRIMNSDIPERRWKSPATAAARKPGIGIPIDSAAVSNCAVSSSDTVRL